MSNGSDLRANPLFLASACKVGHDAGEMGLRENENEKGRWGELCKKKLMQKKRIRRFVFQSTRAHFFLYKKKKKEKMLILLLLSVSGPCCELDKCSKCLPRELKAVH
uniref:Uncharacterized protein n=1 Tax=Trypanosoma congolense (strain IL3000) TaxID=1068625 RepID=G0UNB2_TRYCI|nr:hypothetical protein, unlikely [Trypanosoma congolense IL3000]